MQEVAEEPLLHQTITYNKKRATLLVFASKILIHMRGVLQTQAFFKDIDRFQRSKWKGGVLTDKSVAKLRIVPKTDSPIDLAFTGITCEDDIGKVLKIVKDMHKEATREDKEEPEPVKHLPDCLLTDKERFIRTHPVLNQIRHDLVETGVVPEKEFWDNFRVEITKHNEEHVRNLTVEDRSENLQLTLSRDNINYILRNNQRIAMEYKKWIEEHPSDEYADGISPEDSHQFWVKVFESLAFNQSTEEPIIAIPKKDDVRAFIELDKSKKEEDSELPIDLTPAYVRPDIKLMQEDTDAGIMTAGDHISKDFASIVRSVNAMSEQDLVNSGFLGPNATPTYEKYEADAEDLDYGEEPVEVPENEQVEHGSRLFAEMLLSYKDNFSKIPTPPRLSYDEAAEALDEATRASNHILDSDDYKSRRGSINKALDVIRKHKLEQQILLHYFWMNWESREPESEEKAIRLRDKLLELREMMEREKRSFVTAEVAQLMIPLYQDMEDAFNRVFEKY